MTLNNLKIGQRLGLGFSLLVGLLVAITVTALLRLQDSAAQTRAMMDVPLTKERAVSDWYANVNAGVRRTGAIARSADPSLVEFFADDVKEASKISSTLQKQIEGLLSNDREREVFAKLAQSRATFIRVRDEITALKKEGQAEQALELPVELGGVPGCGRPRFGLIKPSNSASAPCGQSNRARESCHQERSEQRSGHQRNSDGGSTG